MLLLAGILAWLVARGREDARPTGATTGDIGVRPAAPGDSNAGARDPAAGAKNGAVLSVRVTGTRPDAAAAWTVAAVGPSGKHQAAGEGDAEAEIAGLVPGHCEVTAVAPGYASPMRDITPPAARAPDAHRRRQHRTNGDPPSSDDGGLRLVDHNQKRS